MTTWLHCRCCDIKEALIPGTPIIGCTVCGAPRYAVNDEDQPIFLFTDNDEFDNWLPRDDSDDTEGRKLYRARADALANAQVAYGKRRIKPVEED